MIEVYHRFSKAWDSINSKLVDITDLPRSRNGKNCGCTCIECKQQLEACQGFVRKWYFRHQTKTNCKGGPMTALHIMAQQLLVGDRIIQTSGGPVEYIKATMEYRLPNSHFEADIAGQKNDGQLFVVEVFVKHMVQTVKQEYFSSNQIHAIEINLSDIDPDINEGDLLEVLLNDTSIQRVLFDPKPSTIINQNESSYSESSSLTGFLGFAALAAIVYGVTQFFHKPSKTRSKKKRYVKSK